MQNQIQTNQTNIKIPLSTISKQVGEPNQTSKQWGYEYTELIDKSEELAYK